MQFLFLRRTILLQENSFMYLTKIWRNKCVCGYVELLSVMWISIDKYICMQSVYIFVSVSIFPPVPLHQWMSLTLIVIWSKDKEIIRTRFSYHLSDYKAPMAMTLNVYCVYEAPIKIQFYYTKSNTLAWFRSWQFCVV